MGIFDGVCVVDLSNGIAGPMVAMLLADNGAQVTAIDLGDHGPQPPTTHHVWRRGTRHAVLDLTSPSDRATLLATVASADVLIESFAPGEAAAHGLDHDTLAATNPALITLSISAYGDHPTHRHRPADDTLVMARTGLLYDQKGRIGGAMEFINGRPGPNPEFGLPEGLRRGADRDGPVVPRSNWPSLGAMYLGMLGVCAALRARQVSGRGDHVRTSLLSGALAATCLNWQRVGNPDAELYWMWPIDGRSIEGLFECADGRWVHHWVVRPSWVLACAEGDTLSGATIDTAYRDDPDRLSMDGSGMLTGLFLYPMLAEAFAKFPSAEWIAAAEAAGMGMALVRSATEALADPSFLADGCVAEIDDPQRGVVRHVGNVLDFSAHQPTIGAAAPRRGEHTDLVRAEADEARTVAEHPDQPLRQSATSDAPTHGGGPLAGIRVIDLGLGVAGPFAGRLLADLGAEVIKVHAVHDTYWAGTHMGLGTNRGKRSVALNLKHPQGRDVLHRLVATADVLTTNWRPGAMARLGLDAETLHARHPRLVVCNSRGFEKGPRSDLPGTDQTAAALTGTEWEDGGMDHGNPPLWSRSNMGDTGNALLSAIAITAALFDRERSGVGQSVSTSIVNAGLLHTSYAWTAADGTPGAWAQVNADQTGYGDDHRLFRCADDRWIYVAAVQADERAALATLSGPAEQRAERFAAESAAVWQERFDAAAVPAEIVDEQFCRTLFDDPHAVASGLIATTSARSVGRFEDPGVLVTFDGSPAVIQRGPCMCGEHSAEILAEIGLNEAEIGELAAAGAVFIG